MRLTMKSGSKLILDKPQPVGGSGGQRFDSGCNLSGVAKVHIECGYINMSGFYSCVCRSTIKRIYLEFNKPSDPQCRKEPSYHGFEYKRPDDRMRTFVLDPNDEIVKIVVWTEGTLANAVCFHTRMGLISQTYGIPKDGTETVEFHGGKGRRLVGVYGRFGYVIDSLGFTFASIVPGDKGSKVEESLDSDKNSELSYADADEWDV